MYSITFADGQTVADLELERTWFVSDKKIDDIIKGNLSSITISDGEHESTLVDQKIAGTMEQDGKYYYAFCEMDAADVNDSFMVDMDYRLTLLELGVTE